MYEKIEVMDDYQAKIRSQFASGELTWADVLIITGWTPEQAFNLLYDLINN
jgi:ABC-type glycerol-3-phosphate transport system substrate-binding protein